MPKYIAALYSEHGSLTSLDKARADAVKISVRNNGRMVYVNRDELGNPYGVVFPVKDKWIWEPRWGKSVQRTINPRTGKIIKD